MKRSILLLGLLFAFGMNHGQAQIKNQKTVTAKVKGNCGMCKKTIENAGNEKNISSVVWNADSETATINFDPNKTNEEAILKKIAQAGYDNESFRAPDDVYAKLHECCLYERDHQTPATKPTENHSNHSDHQASQSSDNQGANELNSLFGHYLALKDALVASNGKQATQHAEMLAKAIQAVDMKKLADKEHQLWMKVYKQLEQQASSISKDKSIDNQRKSFIQLSENMYALSKVANYGKTLYWQHCPMANQNKGANWLSTEENIKNPYYGSKMLTCGSVVEKI